MQLKLVDDAVALTRTLVADNEQLRPEGTDGVRFTRPENPFRLVIVIAEVPTTPATTAIVEGFPVIVKSGARPWIPSARMIKGSAVAVQVNE